MTSNTTGISVTTFAIEMLDYSFFHVLLGLNDFNLHSLQTQNLQNSRLLYSEEITKHQDLPLRELFCFLSNKQNAFQKQQFFLSCICCSNILRHLFSGALTKDKPV